MRTEDENLEKTNDKRRNAQKMTVVTSELLTSITEKQANKEEKRRNLMCSCGTYDPNANGGRKGCCFCITDGCGSTASVCCDKHSYCNCVDGDCGFCIDLGYETGSVSTSLPNSTINKIFSYVAPTRL
jgi:hypothetical protein